MTTLTEMDIIELRQHPRTIVRDALKATCDRLQLGEAHLRTIVDQAMDERAIHNMSLATTIEHGFRLAESLAHKLRPRRAQLRMPPGPEVA